jgi:restriction system protein
MAFPTFPQLFSIVTNWARLLGRPSHQRKIRNARRVLRTIRSFEGENAGRRTFEYLRQIHPNVFEELVLSAMQDAGFRVQRSLRYSGDGGEDGRVHVPGLGWLPIQSKRYSSHISAQHVKDFGELVLRRRKPLGLFVHTGVTGEHSKQAARQGNVSVLSGTLLLKLVRERSLYLPEHVFR